MKVCSKCKIEKTLDCFYKDLKRKSGLYPSCINCIKEYRELNKEKIKIIRNISNKKYREKNKEKIKEKIKLYKELNKDKIKISRKKYREKNKEKIKLYWKEYYEKNKKYLFNQFYKKRNENPLLKLKQSIRCNIKNSFKYKRTGFKKNSRTEVILGCTIEEFVIYIQSQFKKGMTLENHGQWHLDHIIPLASATTEDEIIKLNHYTNFQPLWAKENIIKRDKIIEKQLKLL
jgi:hypothetical protein